MVLESNWSRFISPMLPSIHISNRGNINPFGVCRLEDSSGDDEWKRGGWLRFVYNRASLVGPRPPISPHSIVSALPRAFTPDRASSWLSTNISIKRYSIGKRVWLGAELEKGKTTKHQLKHLGANREEKQNIKKTNRFSTKLKSFMGNFIRKVNNRNIKLYLIKKIYLQRTERYTIFLSLFFYFSAHLPFGFLGRFPWAVFFFFFFFHGFVFSRVTVPVLFYKFNLRCHFFPSNSGTAHLPNIRNFNLQFW